MISRKNSVVLFFLLSSVCAYPSFCQTETDSLTYYWQKGYFEEYDNRPEASCASYKRVISLCENEPLDIREWYRGVAYLGIARTQSALGNSTETRNALSKSLAHRFWNFGLIQSFEPFTKICGKAWIDSICHFWSGIREKEIPFWHSQPTLIMQPRNFDPKKRYPIIIALQGGNDCYERIAKKFTVIPDSLGILVAVPAASHRISEITNSWDGDTAAAFEKLHSFIAELWKNPNIDTENISLLGYSQGSEMSYDYAFHHPEEIKNVYAFAGFAPPHLGKAEFQNTAAHHVRFIAISGISDASEFLRSTEELSAMASSYGISFLFKKETDLPHGLPINLTEYFGKLWNTSPEKTASSVQSPYSRTR